MPVDVAASAVGLALSVLYKYIAELIIHPGIEKSREFKPLLENICINLKALHPEIEQIQKKNQELDRPDELKDFKKVIDDGIALVDGLKEVAHWYKKPIYTNKLKELDKSLHTQMKLLGMRLASQVANLSVIASITEGNTTNIRMQVGNLSEQFGMQMGNLSVQMRNLNTTQDNIVEMLHRQNGLEQNQAKVGWFGVPKPPLFTVGLEIHVDELKKKLLEAGVSMALITGHPGSGKTTLAKALCQHKELKDKFKIIFVNVSERSNTEVVQEICEKEGDKVLGFQSEEIALDRLQQLLNNTGRDPVLLVLDNVWPGNRSTNSLLASLESKESEMSNYKILVTSRCELPKFNVVYHVKELNDEDAMSLLRNSASPAVSSISEDIQRKVVECCKRLPFFIEFIGTSLSDKDSLIWEDRVEAWSSGRTSFISENDLIYFLQSSLDALGEKEDIIKECFKDLASFPQGQRIPASVLIDVWTVHIDREEADKDRSCIAKLKKLINWRLADLVITRNDKGETDGYYGEHFVTQHDLLRELAIHHTGGDNKLLKTPGKRLILNIRGDYLPMWWENKMDQPFEEVRLVSITTDSRFVSKWCDLQLPKAEVLVLNFHTKSYALPEFVEKMEKLMVLILTNHGFLPAEVSNVTLLGSLSELKRIRLERICVSSITKNRIELQRLQKISFFMCNMGQALRGSIKFFEAFPELQEINIDYCVDLVELPADIRRLIYLKKLSITNCHKLSALPETIGDLVDLELLRLRSCTYLSELPSSVGKLEKLKVLDISNCFSLKELPKEIGELCSLEKLNMRQCSRLQELPESVLDLEKLTKVICDEHTELWEPFLPSLRDNIQIRMVKEEISLQWLL